MAVSTILLYIQRMLLSNEVPIMLQSKMLSERGQAQRSRSSEIHPHGMSRPGKSVQIID